MSIKIAWAEWYWHDLLFHLPDFIFTDRSNYKCGTFLWIICVVYVLCFSCFRVCSMLPCGHLLGKGWPLDSCLWGSIVFLSLSHVVSWAQVWYFIVSISDLCRLSYFNEFKQQFSFICSFFFVWINKTWKGVLWFTSYIQRIYIHGHFKMHTLH